MAIVVLVIVWSPKLLGVEDHSIETLTRFTIKALVITVQPLVGLTVPWAYKQILVFVQ